MIAKVGIALVIAATILVSYTFGHRAGVDDAPEAVAYWKAFDATLVDIPAGSHSREAVCEKIFDMIEAELTEEQYLLEQEIRD